jgi:hypothetical protein
MGYERAVTRIHELLDEVIDLKRALDVTAARNVELKEMADNAVRTLEWHKDREKELKDEIRSLKEFDIAYTKSELMEFRSDVYDRAHKALDDGQPELALWYFGNYNAYQAAAFDDGRMSDDKYVDNHEYTGDAPGVWSAMRAIDEKNQRFIDQVLLRSFVVGVVMTIALGAIAHSVKWF